MWTFYSEIIIACIVGLLAYLHKTLSGHPVPIEELLKDNNNEDRDDQLNK